MLKRRYDTRNKGSNEIDNGTSSDEKGQTQSKGFGEKSAKAGKGKKQDQIDKLKEEENDDESNQHKRAASPVYEATKLKRRILGITRRHHRKTIWKSTAVTNATWEKATSRKGHTSTTAIPPAGNENTAAVE